MHNNNQEIIQQDIVTAQAKYQTVILPGQKCHTLKLYKYRPNALIFKKKCVYTDYLAINLDLQDKVALTKLAESAAERYERQQAKKERTST